MQRKDWNQLSLVCSPNELYNVVQAHEVLKINPSHFRLRKPIERRLYELARKHCGNQAHFERLPLFRSPPRAA
ncbi:MAG: replication initiator protein A [Nitrosospira sp.]|nr:replication initiator protein A [Nitrosospira sp.]